MTVISFAVFWGRHPHPLNLSDVANPIGHPSRHISVRYLGELILLTFPLAFSGHRILLIFLGFTVCCPSIFVGGSSSLLQQLTLGVPGHWEPRSPSSLPTHALRPPPPIPSAENSQTISVSDISSE